MPDNDKLNQILKLISEYVIEKKAGEKWEASKDWLQYSGPTFDDKEYVAAVESLLSEWLIFGKNCGKFEAEFPKHLGKSQGVITNSGSSANLLMVYTMSSKNILPKSMTLPKGAKIITPVVCFPTTLNPTTTTTTTTIRNKNKENI